MFQKRKKFTREATTETRLTDRWDQQVFFILNKYPHVQGRISAIMSAHRSGQAASAFVPSEDALTELANLYSDLQGASPRA